MKFNVKALALAGGLVWGLHVPILPRVGETVTLDGNFRQRGAFVVERVEHMFCCDSRRAGWVRDLSVHVSLFVREN